MQKTDMTQNIKLDNDNRKILVSSKGNTILIPIHEIKYFESNLRKLIIVTSQEKYETYKKLSEVDTGSLSGFVRCHKSFLVNLTHVKSMSDNQFVLCSGESIPIAQRRAAAVKKTFIDYCRKNFKVTIS
jgi:DNA-binding LytR/AlgR family response regulator